ncbi:MAG: SDR family NAD(P)-dependent oxidoreductase [Haloarculaceae archaeon]
MDLADSVALVTGGSGAIGQAVAEELARAGASVAVGYHSDEEGAQRAVERAEAHGVTARALQADVTDEDAAAGLVEQAAAMGDLRALVVCAGVTDPHAIEDLDAETLDRVLSVNVTGAANVARPAVEQFRGKGGAVVAVSSVAADLGTVDATYATAKAGLQGFVRALARELGPEGVRANVVAPGPVDTPMNDRIVEFLEAQRFRGHDTVDTLLDRYEAQPEEVAEAVRFLVTHEFITGEILRVDGGLSLG